MTANTPNSSSRRWLYGFNSALIVLVAVVALGFIDYLTSAVAHRPFDLTTGHVNSLSGQTRKLLETIDGKGKDYELVSTFPLSRPADDTRNEEQRAEDRTKQVADLLTNYARASKHITYNNVATLDEVTAKIRDRYQAETKPYQDAIDDFPALVDSIQKFCKIQAAEFGSKSQQAGLSSEDQKYMLSGQSYFGSELPDFVAKIRSGVNRITVDSTSPQWSKATMLINSALDSITEKIDPLTNVDPKELDVLGKFFKEHGAEYKKISQTIHAYKDRLGKLAPLKVDEVMDSLEGNSIVVLGPNIAKVIGPSEIYKAQQQGQGGAASSTFEGEQAVTSGLLALSEPNKPKVVFVSGTPQQMMTGNYSEITGLLQKDNFEVLEWSPAPQPAPGGEAPPMPAPPPASGKDVVWIVFPPEAPNMQMMMAGMPPPDPRPLIEAVKKHLDAGGSALFLAESSSGMFGAPGAGYPFAELIKPFGIQVESKYTVVQQSDADPNGNQHAIPQILITNYPKTPITETLQSLRTILFGQPSRGGGMNGGPTVVTIAEGKPADVRDEVIVRTERTDTIWASSSPNVASGDAKFDKDKDLAAPVSMGVSAESAKGQRVVVLGSKLFPANPALDALAVETRNGQRVAIPAFPGNSELLLNSVYWLSGHSNMIAVGPQARVAERIAAMSSQKESFLRAGAFIVPPLLAIIIGIFVFVIRHR